jgi:hypothetical protein
MIAVPTRDSLVLGQDFRTNKCYARIGSAARISAR